MERVKIKLTFIIRKIKEEKKIDPIMGKFCLHSTRGKRYDAQLWSSETVACA